MSRHRKLGRTCASCGIGICDESTTGKCKPCWCREHNSDPEKMRQRGAALSRKLRTDPEAYARKCATLAKNRAKAFSNPFYMARLRAQAPRLASYKTPETEARRIEALVAANKRRRHAWLPDEWRPVYFKMLRSNGYRAKEAKKIILEQIEAEARRAGNDETGAVDAVMGSRNLLEAIRRAHG